MATTAEKTAAETLASMRKTNTYVQCAGYLKTACHATFYIGLFLAIIATLMMFLESDPLPGSFAAAFWPVAVLAFTKMIFYWDAERSAMGNLAHKALTAFEAGATSPRVVTTEFAARSFFSQAFYDFIVAWLENGQPTELWRLEGNNPTRRGLVSRTGTLRLLVFLLLQDFDASYVKTDAEGFLTGEFKFDKVKGGDDDYYFDWRIGPSGLDIAIGKFRKDGAKDIRLFRDTIPASTSMM